MATKHKTVVSGIQPSGASHIGNFAGSFSNWLKLQEDKSLRRLFFIADYHSITENYDPEAKRAQVMDMAMDLLAVGLDPKKSTIFVQSEVPEHTELCWIFNTVTPVSFLERMTQFKDKSAHQALNVNMGLFDYPVLQAADILLYKGDSVPVGRDQIQHVELTRDIARFFNNKYGETFPEAQPLLTETPKIRSLTEPLKKMSKSLGEKNLIALADTPEIIEEKLKRAVTETTGIVKLSEEDLERRLALPDLPRETIEELRGQSGVWSLLTLVKVFGKPHEADRILAAQPIKYGELKKLAALRISEYFAPFRAKRQALAKNPKKIRAILDAGAKKARSEAKKTMAEVRKKIGLR